ncbi:MAG: hypothetical protein HFJ80_06850 [Clostridiales bacterium]|nr:hypothetical protein [Clostridiales bacterium]
MKKHKKPVSPGRRSLGILLMLLLCCLAGVCLGGAYFLLSRGDSPLSASKPGASLFISEEMGGNTGASSAQGSLEDFINRAIFIGDSRTNGLAGYGYLDKERVYAIDGGNHVAARTERFIRLEKGGRLLTIAEAVGVVQPDYMLVSFGINGVAFLEEEAFFTEYALFLDELKEKSPGSTLIVQAILPVSSSYQQQQPLMANQKIKRYNARLEQLSRREGALFWDTFDLLADGKGNLAPRYDSGDGLHLNSGAYQTWLDALDVVRKTW